MKMNKKWISIGALAVLVLGGGFWGYKHFTAKPAAASTITDQVKRGDIRKAITATGTVNFPQAIPLTLQQAGKLAALNVKVGDTVKAGQVLAQLDPTSLSQTVAQQQANLVSAQAKLQQLRDGFNTQTLAQAQSQLAKAQQEVAGAQQALTTAQQNADSSYLANQVYLANQNVLLASDALAKAQQSGVASSIQQAQSALSQAQTALVNAQNAQNGGAAQALAAAQANYQAAQADLTAAQSQVDQQNQGPKQGDLESAQAGIVQAQSQLAAAELNLANATLTAPVDGVISTVGVQNYQYVGANTTIATLGAGNNTLQVDAAVDQADIAQVKVGQKADITLDSAPDQHISGTVTEVAVQGTTVQNVTTFDVTVQVDQANALLHAGMSANVSIIQQEAKNVLIVPSEAIRGTGDHKGVLVPGAAPAGSAAGSSANGGNRNKSTNQAGNSQNGTNSQNRQSSLANIDAHYVPVETGLDDGTNTEIISGLSEGQDVIIGIRSATSSKSTTQGVGPGSSNNPGQSMGQLRGAVNGRGR